MSTLEFEGTTVSPILRLEHLESSPSNYPTELHTVDSTSNLHGLESMVEWGGNFAEKEDSAASQKCL